MCPGLAGTQFDRAPQFMVGFGKIIRRKIHVCLTNSDVCFSQIWIEGKRLSCCFSCSLPSLQRSDVEVGRQLYVSVRQSSISERVIVIFLDGLLKATNSSENIFSRTPLNESLALQIILVGIYVIGITL